MVFAHNEPQTKSCDIFECLALFNHNPDELLCSFTNVNMCSSQHSGDQAVVITMGFSGRMGAKEDQIGFVSQKKDDRFLACTRYIIHFDYLQRVRTFKSESYANLSGLFVHGEKALLPRLWKGTHVSRHFCKTVWIRSQITPSSIAFSRYTPSQYFLYPN